MEALQMIALYNQNFVSTQNSVYLFTHHPGEHRKMNIYNDQILMESVLNLAS